MGDLIRTTDFRRALSLAVDRDQVNETFFLGTSIPSCTMVSDDSPYFPGQDWRRKWADLDIDQANEMLDGIGLSKRNGDGFRMLPSGKGPVRVEMQSTNTKADFPTWGEMIRRHWVKIGIDSSSDLVDGTLLYERAQANKVMAARQQCVRRRRAFPQPELSACPHDCGHGGRIVRYRVLEVVPLQRQGGHRAARLDADPQGHRGALPAGACKLPRDQRSRSARRLCRRTPTRCGPSAWWGWAC